MTQSRGWGPFPPPCCHVWLTWAHTGDHGCCEQRTAFYGSSPASDLLHFSTPLHWWCDSQAFGQQVGEMLGVCRDDVYCWPRHDQVQDPGASNPLDTQSCSQVRPRGMVVFPWCVSFWGQCSQKVWGNIEKLFQYLVIIFLGFSPMVNNWSSFKEHYSASISLGNKTTQKCEKMEHCSHVYWRSEFPGLINILPGPWTFLGFFYLIMINIYKEFNIVTYPQLISVSCPFIFTVKVSLFIYVK